MLSVVLETYMKEPDFASLGFWRKKCGVCYCYVHGSNYLENINNLAKNESGEYLPSIISPHLIFDKQESLL